MKITKSVVFAGIALASLAVASQDDGTLIRRKLEANTQDSYQIETKMHQTVNSPMTGEQEVSVNNVSTYLLKYGVLDDKGESAKVTGTITVDKLDADGPMAGALGKKPEPVNITGKIDTRNRLTLDKIPGADQMAMMMGGAQSATSASMFVELPEKAVKIGDSWDVVIPKSPFTGKEDQKLTAKLVESRQVDGKDVWVISVEGPMKIEFDSATVPKDPKASDNPMANMRLVIKGTVGMKSEGLVDKATGKTLSMKSSGKIKLNMEIADAGLTFDSSGTVESKVTLK